MLSSTMCVQQCRVLLANNVASVCMGLKLHKIARIVNFRMKSKDVALLSLIMIVEQSSSFVFVWLSIVLRCWLLLSLLFG